MATSAEQWLEGFLTTVLGGEWAALFVQALITSLIAVTVGIAILRRQLASDRALSAKQSAEALDLARAQRRADAAATIGRVLNQAANSDRELSNLELGGLLRARGRPQDQELFEAARTEGVLHFEEFTDHPLFIAVRERTHAWRLAGQILEDERWIGDAIAGHAYRKLVARANRDLRNVAGELIRWDGFGALPRHRATVTSTFPVGANSLKSRSVWSSAFRTDFLAAARRRSGTGA